MKDTDWKKVETERRSKILYIGYKEVFDYCAVRHGSSHIMTVISTYDLPKEWLIGGVNYSFERRAFAYLISSPDFDPVPDGAEYPTLLADITRCKITRDVDIS